jgi:glycosyltransferase involved in cell wall biosynthesis
MREQPFVSVIMNCYNGEKYLAQAIESVLAQTWTHWEIIFWDNHSTDQSAAIFKSYDDPRLHYHYAPNHTLLYEARNYAIAKARGNFLAFLDVDDWWAPQKLALQLPAFDDPEVGMVCSNYWIHSQIKNKRWQALPLSPPSGWVMDALLKRYYVGLLTLVIRKTAFASLDYPFDPRYHIIGDFDLVIRLAAAWKLGVLPTAIAFYRVHGANETGKHHARHLAEIEQWIEEMAAHPIIGSARHFSSVCDHKNYIAAMGKLLIHERKQARALAATLPLGRYKRRLLIAQILPHAWLRMLKN